MIEKINTIVILALSIIYAVLYLLGKRNRQSKIDGIEKLSKDIERLSNEKIVEQKRSVKERSDIMFAEFQKMFCETFQLLPDSKKAVYFQNIILNSVRQETDKMMNEVIYINNIAGREGRVWIEYKKQKANFILIKVIEHIDHIYRDDIIGISHAESMTKCRPKIIDLYFPQIEAMFEDVKNISIEYHCKIQEQERVLKSLKNGNNKKKELRH